MSNPATPSEDKDGRAEFARLAREKSQFDQDPIDPDGTILTIGDQDWPCPVPLVRTGGNWRFDSSQSRLGILARRIGRNEMDPFEICRGYAEAQLEYAADNRDGDGILKYAQNIVSSSGKPFRQQSQVCAVKILAARLQHRLRSARRGARGRWFDRRLPSHRRSGKDR